MRKKAANKLHLHRETIRHLAENQLDSANGGTFTYGQVTDCECDTTNCNTNVTCAHMCASVCC